MHIRDNFYLNSITLPATQNKAKTPKNHIFIIDRSGSMSGLIKTVVDNVASQITQLPDNDYVSVGWFSGEGSFGWIVKGASLTDKNGVVQMLNSYKSVLGTTCFSEILEDCDKSLADLSKLAPEFCLFFLTDGYPVVSNYTTEEAKVQGVLTKLSKRLNAALFVGYGEWYNKDFMTSMARWSSGILCHSSNISDIAESVRQYDGVSGASPKISVPVPATTKLAFVPNFETGAVSLLEPVNNTISLPENSFSLLVLSEEPNNGPLTEAEQYASALALFQAGYDDLTISLLGAIGDIFYTNEVANAFTNNERGRVETRLAKAVYDEKYRFPYGKQPGCAPRDDQFCLLNLLDILARYGAELLLDHPDFVYNRVGVSTKPKEGSPVFHKDKEVRAPFDDVVWSGERLNLSLRTRQTGYISLGNEAAKFGLDNKFNTYRWRNYTLIKDGRPNVSSLPVSMNSTTATIIKNEIGERISQNDDGSYTINLKELPTINRAMAYGNRSLNTLCGQVLHEIELQAKYKVLNGAYKEYVDDLRELEMFSQEQEDFLVSMGIGRNGFSPAVEQEPPSDFYVCKEFHIDPSGLSSLPSIKDVRAKLAATTKLTKGQSIIAKGLEWYDNTVSPLLTGKSRQEVAKILQGILTDLRRALFLLRAEMQKAKFSVLLCKLGFDELTAPISETPITYNYAGQDFKIYLKQVVEKI